MLLKCCQTEKKTKMAGTTQKRNAGNTMRLTSASQTAPRAQRSKVVRNIALKRTHRGVKEEPAVEPSCDNSNDSGLGLDQHQEYNVAPRLVDWRPTSAISAHWSPSDETPDVKRKRLEIKIESDDANDDFSFPDSARRTTEDLVTYAPTPERMSAPRPVKRRPQQTAATTGTGPPRGPNLLAGQLLAGGGKARNATSRDGKAQLVIVGQPEQQHRARYQTEGSRGAVKDRTGNGFPQVQLSGWSGAATLEVYIGSDCGKVVPHMFYQACRVSGKNSTQCQERTEEGTVIIEVPFEPTKDMVVTCDCVGILKERNVDVEHRFPEQSGSRNKKKSTRCRMVFRTILTHPDGSQETLQICSQPIACTQPPGVPEICKKSLTSSPVGGGSELFILGKNFLKDTRVLFTNPDLQPPWEASVIPDKEYLQQSHLVCVVPPYQCCTIAEPVTVRLTVTSSDKSSEAHSFTYTPQQRAVDTAEEENLAIKAVHPEVNPSAPDSGVVVHSYQTSTPLLGTAVGSVPLKSSAETLLPPQATQYLLVEPKQGGDRESIFPLVMWKSVGSDGAKLMSVSSKAKDMKLLSLPAGRKTLQPMEPPALVPLLLPSRRLSTSEIKTENEERQSGGERGVCPAELKGIDLRMTAPAREAAPLVTPSLKVSMATGADLSSTLPPSMATLRRFVANDNGSPLPSLSVENFLSRLERKPDDTKKGVKAGVAPQPEQKPVNGNVNVVQSEYVPLDSVISMNMPLGSRPQIVSDYRRLSEEEIASVCLESSRSMHRKPGKVKPYCARTSPMNVQQNGKIHPMSAAKQSILNVVPEQMMFSLQSPALTDIHQRDSLDSRFLNQDLKTSVTRRALDATCQQPAQNVCSDAAVRSHTNTFVTGSMESTVGCLPAGNVDAVRPSPEFIALPRYEEETSNLESQSKNVSTPRHETSPFDGYRDESLQSPPIESKGIVMPLQEPPFENHSVAHVDSSPNNSVLTSHFIAVTGTSAPMCSQPVASNNVIKPSQVLPELNNNHRLSTFHCTPLPSIAENTRLPKEEALSPVANVYVVSETVSSNICTLPIQVKNILMHSQEPALFNNYVTESVPAVSVGQSQMLRENNIVIESALNGGTTACQTSADANVCTMHVSNNNTLIDPNVSNVNNQVVTTSSSSPLFASKNITMCSQDMYNFPPEHDTTTSLTCSPPSGCISSHDSLILGNHDLASVTSKTGLVNSLSLTVGNNYNITLVPQDGVTSPLPKPYAPTPLMQDPAVGTGAPCSLPPAVTNGGGLLATLDAPARGEGSLGDLSGLLLRPSPSSHRPPAATKTLILDGCDAMLGGDKLTPSNSTPEATGAYPGDRAIAMKNMMLRVDVSSTMEDQMMSQPGAVTPETVRLDALVNSTLDSHIHPPSFAPTPACLRFPAEAGDGCTQKAAGPAVRERREEGMLPHELTQMSDHDLISYINPSCFDQV